MRVGGLSMFKGSFKKHSRVSIPAYVLLSVISIAAAIISPDFSRVGNISNVLAQVAPLAIVAVGQTLILILGATDLSSGSVVSFATVIMVKVSVAVTNGITNDSTVGLILAILLCLGMGALVGLINGLGIMRLNIPPMIMTLATGAIVKGIALYVQPSSGGMVNKAFAKFITRKFEPFNMLFIIVLITYALFVYLLAGTKWGRNIYAVGGSSVNATKNGISVERTQISAYTVAGMLSGLGGILLASRMFSADPLVGDTYSLDSITAVIVGGTLITGGTGGVIGTLGGVFLVAMMGNVLNMLEIFPYYQYIIKGLILIIALFIGRVDKVKLKGLFQPVQFNVKGD